MLPLFFQRHSRRVLLVFACLLPVIVWGAMHAYDRRDNSVLGWLPERSPVTQAYHGFLRAFGPDEAVLVSWEGCELDDPGLERLAEAVEQRIAAADVATAPDWFAAVTTGTRLRDRVADAATLDRTEAAHRLGGVLIGPDGRTTCALVTLNPLDDPGRRAAVDWIADAASAAAALRRDSLRLTGDAVIGVAIDTENERTAGTWSNVAMLAALTMACLSLGSLRLGAMVVAVAGFASLAIESLIWFSGGTMNMLVALVPVVTFVLALSAAVHLAAYWEDSIPAHGLEAAAGAAVGIGWQPGFVATLTTVLGMASLCVSQVTPVWHFGLYAAIGAVFAFVIVFTALPALLHTWGALDSRSPTADGGWSSLVRGVQRLVGAHRRTTALFLAMMAAAGAGLFWMRTEVRPARFLPQQSRWIQDLHWFNDHVAPFQTVDVVLTFAAPHTGLGDRGALVQAVQERLTRIDDVRGSMSAATFLPDELLGAADRSELRSVIRRGVIDGRLRRNLPTLIDAGMVAEDEGRQLWRISLQVANFTADKQRRLEADINRIAGASVADLGVPAPAATLCTGGVPLVIAAQRELLDALLESFALAFVTIVAVLAAFLRSAAAGLLAMIPNVLPPVVVFGLLGWLGWPLDVGGMMTASVALGISVDDTAHLLTWFTRAGHAAGATRRDVRRQIDEALSRSAAPITRTSLIIGLAFGIFGFCGFKPIAQFGMLLAALMALALVGDLVLLPALLAGPAGRLLGRGVEQHDAADDQEHAG